MRPRCVQTSEGTSLCLSNEGPVLEEGQAPVTAGAG